MNWRITFKGPEFGTPTIEAGKKMNRLNLTEFRKEALRKSAVKAEFDRIQPAYKLRRKLIEIRLKAGYTQEQMAAALKTKKSNISRLENVNSPISPTIKTIERYAKAVGYTLDINFIPTNSLNADN